jgi:DNA adenine methylase
MVYMGGKCRIARDIYNVICQHTQPEQAWVEPFGGGLNMIAAVPPTRRRIANDSNQWLVAMWQSLLQGWTPPETITLEQYKNIRDNKENYPACLVGWVGFVWSFRGKFFAGWCGNQKRKYHLEQSNSILRQLPFLVGVELFCGDYRDMIIPANSIVYCDPPYAGTTKYSEKLGDGFWDWCRELSKNGNKVFVSEYEAPDDFECVWKKEKTCSLGTIKGGVGIATVEKLVTRKENAIHAYNCGLLVPPVLKN